MSNFDTFVQIYTEELKNAVVNYPDEYGWPVENVPTVAQKMAVAFKNKTYNKDGRAIKATCKRLNIKYTYTAINEYLAA
ncbi:hypothetical protein [Nitrospira sp. BLG_2]|uniref:hypothetical protein n=1 Tax=Nitrospira sp. BLG_2 TaxID=3397507 RepID=UPI003B993144